MNKNLKKNLEDAVKKYGNDVNIAYNSQKIDRDSVINQIELQNPDDKTVYKSIVGLGQILEEDLNNHQYIILVRVGKVFSKEALMVAVLDNKTMYMAAYAQEGLVKQNIALKAINMVLNQIKE